MLTYIIKPRSRQVGNKIILFLIHLEYNTYNTQIIHEFQIQTKTTTKTVTTSTNTWLLVEVKTLTSVNELKLLIRFNMC